VLLQFEPTGEEAFGIPSEVLERTLLPGEAGMLFAAGPANAETQPPGWGIFSFTWEFFVVEPKSEEEDLAHSLTLLHVQDQSFR
jgi:hypothetical protein